MLINCFSYFFTIGECTYIPHTITIHDDAIIMDGIHKNHSLLSFVLTSYCLYRIGYSLMNSSATVSDRRLGAPQSDTALECSFGGCAFVLGWFAVSIFGSVRR